MRIDKSKYKKSSNVSPINTTTIHHIFVLDCSISMSGEKFKSLVASTKEMIAEKHEEVEYLYTIITFDSYVTILCTRNPFPDLNISCRGCTALNDAIIEAVSHIKKGEHTIIDIFTDGQENNSKATNQDVKLAIKNNQEFATITFNGTAQDVKYAKLRYDLEDGNLNIHDNTAKGIAIARAITKKARVEYAATVARGGIVDTKNFYK